ncbi:adenylate kinase 9 [Rhinophrynus dorsalis]
MAPLEKAHLPPLADTFNEDEAERAFLVSKPTCFLIVGKPGTGKTTLGKKLSQSWQCIFIEAKELITEHIRRQTEQGIKIEELLYQGHNVPEELVTQLMVDKINSPEVAHLGYVLCGFPSLCEEYVKIPEQIELIKNFKLTPDVIINIKCPDKDLSKRLCGQKQDPDTGTIYQHEDWDTNLREKQEKGQEGEEVGEEEEEQEEEEEDSQDVKKVLDRLLFRPEDFPENVDERIKLYKDTLLRPVEDLIIDHNPQYLIELDGNKKTDELFRSVLSRLESLGLRHGAVVMKLQNSEEEETLEGAESDDIFRALASSHIIAPRYRWRRSRWGLTCPVALKDGFIKRGLPQFAVSFLDKMYFLSSEEALLNFMQNPRPYLLPPMPLPPCKVAVVGPKSSGKTTVCNLIANKYSGKVFDMSVLIVPYVEEAKKNAVEKAQEEATELAIKTVKMKLQQERILKEQENGHKDLEKESDETEVTATNQEEKDHDTEEGITPAAAAVIEEINADHPEVQEMVAEAVKVASQTTIIIPPHVYVDALEKAIQEFNKETKERFPGAPPVGGWVLDNFPNSPNYWIAMSDKGLLPDTVICLRDSANNGKFLLNRLYIMNKEEINNNIMQRLQKERARKLQEEEEARREQQEILRLQEEEKQMQAALQKSLEKRADMSEESGDEPPDDKKRITSSQPDSPTELSHTSPLEEKQEPEPEIILPDVPEGGFPDVPEMEPLKQHITSFNEEWLLLEPVFTDSSKETLTFLEIMQKSPEALLQETVNFMERPFQYHSWEMTPEDIDEEAEDIQAELEAEEEEAEEEEEEKEAEDEELARQRRRNYGDSKHFCPVALKDNLILHPGDSDNAAIYREKIYYCSTPEAKDTFIKNPENYTVHEEPLKAPPLRVLLIGTSGAGKTACARWLADKLGIFHIQFQESLQEMMLSKLQKKVGPQYEEEVIEEIQTDEAALLELERNTIIGGKEENDIKTKEEAVLTEEEEAVKSYLQDAVTLPSEVLDQIVTEWWTKEPFRSTGFILDGFPSTVEESQYIGDKGLFPDIAVFLEVEESDVCDRLLPPRLAKWKEIHQKKEARKQKLKEMKMKLRNEQIAIRRAELLEEQNKMKEENRQEKEDPDEEEEEEDEEEEHVDEIELILSEEFPEEEDEDQEEEELEDDAVERMKSEIGDSYEADTESLQAVKEELEKLMIPCVTINGGRKLNIVRYQLYEKLKHIVENRESLFEKGYPVSYALAKKLLQMSYKHPSVFGRWDPVKLSHGEVIKPFQNQENPGFPLIYRQYIYFFSTKENREIFMKNPIKFIRLPKPKLSVPIRIAIVGPPKSGKTTVAKMFEKIYGLQRLSMGDAIRSVLENQPDTELALEIKSCLVKGLVVPDELAIKCLEVAMMDQICNTTGVILDGYPATKHQVDLLEAYSIIPIKIFDLQLPINEVLKRGLEDKKNSNRPYPEHNSSQILAVRNSCYKQEVQPIKQYYTMQHQNWCEVDAMRSKWWVSDKIIEEVQRSVSQIQSYLERIEEGKAAGIADFCITPQELLSRLGEFGQYCPVSLAQRGELIDCSVTSSLRFAAEFRGHYYKMASQEELDAFLEAPELYVPPLAPRPLPAAEMLPKKLSVADVKSKFPKNAEMRGYCPVTYLDGKKRYEALVPGHIEKAVEYRDKIYIFENEEKLQKFMRLPEKYWNLKLPSKLPPKMEPIMLTSLPLTGYLEQGAAMALIKALNEVGCLKPKYPFLSVKRSALLYIAFHLKAHNHWNSDYIRNKYKKKMEQFVECCELITYLGNKMTRKYKEPERRPLDFDFKLQSFLSLKNVDPMCI